jgi:beta-glucanase (GH16 family)
MHGDKNKSPEFHTALLAPSNPDGLPTPPGGHRWMPVESLSDEFNGDQLDRSKWIPRHPYWSRRDSRHEPVNVSVEDGNLRLRSTQRDGATEVKASTVNAACVTSKARNCRPGCYEARVKASDLSMTSAFWLQGQGIEIGVIENIGAPSKPWQEWLETTPMMNSHYNVAKPPISTPRKWKMPTRGCDDYHVFGVRWKDAETFWMNHNGAKVLEITPGGPFDKPQYMFFDTEVFTWHGWPTRESLLDPDKNTMLVDWVRSWKLVPVE